MKRLFTFLLLSLALFATPLQERGLDRAAVRELATRLGVPEEGDLVQETQRRWLRQAMKERWEMQELSPEARRAVLEWGQAQGVFEAWRPARRHYDAALILGATTGCMQRRLDYLKELWEEGVRFDEVVWLTGERPLDPRVDHLVATTEAEAARLLWERASLPPEMRALSVTYVAVPMHAQGARPTTRDTLLAWKSTASSALFVSDQPFCGYQYAIIQATLSPSLLFDVVGPGVDPTSHPAAAAITLDSLARWLYADANNNT